MSTAQQEWLGLAEEQNKLLREVLKRRAERRRADSEEALHYVTQFGQPYGSVSRCCAICGAMCWPGMEGSAQLWTDDFGAWCAADNKCNGAIEAKQRLREIDAELRSGASHD